MTNMGGYDDGSPIKRFFENPDFQCQKVLLGQTIVEGYILSFQKDCGMLELLFVDPQFWRARIRNANLETY